MNDLKTFLWWVFVIFTLICIFLCIEAHFRYRNKKGIDDALVAGEEIKLRNLFDEEEKRKMQEAKAKGLPATSVLPTLLPKKH